ncbi:MAG: DNA repair protein RecO [Fimbriimonadaceae bacterium]|nr:DNA repair protein RecO [Fimbriimonadaceae bacterium]
MSAEGSAEGIVLRRLDSGESDRRIVVLAEGIGKIWLTARGARKAKSRLAGSTDPLTRAQFTWAEGKSTKYVSQVVPRRGYPGVRADYDRLLAGLAMLELVDLAIPTDGPDDVAFELLDLSLSHLESLDPTIVLSWFSVNLLREEGAMPDWTVCAISGATLKHDPILVSPHAGGAIDEPYAGQYRDAFRAPWEALVGLKRLAERGAPPSKMRQSASAALVIERFWQALIDRPLPAHTARRQASHTQQSESESE